MLQTITRPPLNILLVEDDPSHVRLVERGLEQSRFPSELRKAGSVDEALVVLRRQGEYRMQPLPSLILLDLNLPGRNGYDLLKIIKSDESLRRIPVVIFTTTEAEGDRANAYHLHCNSFLVKPSDKNAFCKLIEELGFYWGVWNESPF